MSNCVLTKGRTEPCRDNVGGIKNVYLFPFIEYDYTEIIADRGVEVTSFPATEVYKYEVVEGSFEETINNEDEGIFYDQTLTFSLNKQDITTTNELNILTNIDFRYIVEYNAGYFKIGGLYKGANAEYNITSGGAKSDRNGYTVIITGKEEWKAPFIDMDDFTINGVVYNFILENEDNFIFEDNDNFTFE